ncbi:BamA/TamA family outer membrane protein [Roseomonas elaeocarpi]|uniref:BamA/TamA family outer membrane protein n=1 Tax=Roseomonas elaeocarpi TaxID=907779 RepID=A0ABV6K121_9PROT
MRPLHRLPVLLAAAGLLASLPPEASRAQAPSPDATSNAAAKDSPDAPAPVGSGDTAGAPPSPAEASDQASLPYETTLKETGNGELDGAIRTVSALRRLQTVAPTTAEGLVARATQERDLVTRALRAEGFYDGKPVVLVDGKAPDTPNLALDIAHHQGPVPVTVGAEPGPRYTIGSLRVSPEVPEADISGAGDIQGIKVGDPARSEAVISAGDKLTEGMKDTGFPFAQVVRRRVVVDHDTHLMEVTYILQPGPRARFATPSVEGATRVDPKMLNAVAGQLDGRQYDPKQLDRVRRDLVNLGVFGTVRTKTGDALDNEGRLPTTFLVVERPRHAIGITGAYETRNGPTVTTYWEHRNLFGGAEKLRLEGTVGRTDQSSSGNSFNAKVDANLRSPWIAGRNLTLVADIAAIRERLLAYNRDAVTGSLALETKPEPRLTLSGGILTEVGRTTEFETPTRHYQLVGLLGTAVWEDTDNLLDPSKGVRGNLLVSPIYPINGGDPFVRLRATGSGYYDVTGSKSTILAGRLSVGSIVGTSDYLAVPPQLRFYSGGGGSVRGYDFQRIGPRRANDTPRGGLSVVEASIEVRQKVYGNFGMAAFVDGGSVGSNSNPSFNSLAFGAGLGVRYATAIGPIRADVALPLKDISGNSGYGLYVGIGQAF